MRKITSLCLAIFMLSATGVAYAESQVSFSMENIEIDLNETNTISVPVMIDTADSAPGFVNAGFTVDYDNEYLTITGVQKSTDPTMEEFIWLPNDVDFSKFAYAGYNNVAYDGNFATVDFVVSEDAPDGYETEIKFTILDMAYIDEATNFYNVDVANDSEGVAARATVKVSNQEIITGDANLDGRVNLNDAVAILRYSIGALELTDAQLKAAETVGDTRVNLNDAVKVLRFSIGAIDSLD